MKRIAFPSKTFLLGEYAALEQLPAILIGHGPHFEAEIDLSISAPCPFHPASPAGKIFQNGEIRFFDPHQGRGGFGASGAEYLSVWSARIEWPKSFLERDRFAWKAWEESRSFPGSGADILTQAFGINQRDPFLLHIDMASRQILQASPKAMGITISIFHTGKKIATHENLRAPPLPKEEMREIVDLSWQALAEGNAETFAQGIREYGKILANLGLVAAPTGRILKNLPPVLAAKGCGAMGADVILVLHESQDLSSWAAENSLAEIARIPV